MTTFHLNYSGQNVGSAAASDTCGLGIDKFMLTELAYGLSLNLGARNYTELF